MIRLRNRFLRNVKSTVKRIDNFVVRHWTTYNSFVVIYTVIGIPLLLRFSKIATISYLSLVPFFALSILSAIETFKVAEKNPYAFIKVEKLKYWVSLSFWFLFISQLVCLGLMMLFAKLNVQEELILKLVDVFSWVVLLFIGVALYSSFFSSFSFAGRKDLFRIMARACFRIVSNALSSGEPQEQKKKLSFFKKGMKNYNEYLKRRFDFVIRRPQRYYNYVKLTVSLELSHRIEHIGECIENLANLLRTESDLIILHSSMKTIIGETIQNYEEMTEDFDFEVGIRKWLSSHKDSVTVVIALASLVVTFISFVTRMT